MTDTVYQQILAIRVHPDCPNMFDAKAVFELAVSEGYYELADFIFTDTRSYSRFILTGERK